ncbi:MAG: SDR family oxidoreductase [Flavobacteriaceae bacterium]|jgi:short-subunit dehydrogenase|nr:SDR family oxidoreductase [Flavobacteriaceae bacterium]
MKNVIITGASRGIGFDLLKLFNNENYNVFALSRNISNISSFKNVNSIVTDLSSPESIGSSVEIINNKIDSVDILINNAGFLINKPFKHTTFSDFESVYKVNVFGLAELIRLIIPKLNSQSHIVNISSIGGISGTSKFPGLSAYSSSKGALNILTEMLSEEFKEINTKINTLALGAVQTEMLNEAFPGYKAPLSSKEMAKFIFDFSLNGHNFFNGKIIPVSISNP